ncbi:hypothetical protein SAMN06265795_12825 [Noviherbaspirillum humi]|uniref:Uncharacterized protein n=1 Tax=Noviherbaspirillum humi TaxID=1688639 RepID=A0A239LZV4_9BURK|nr:hypothetical protein [Noviherbaspirillum humi]SNT35552.1 hypothetical protein SAMN06265795_12825 [Noviherbaspirillum humi]
MTQEEILALFREHADTLPLEAQAPMLRDVILDLAQLLADSRGRLSKENFDTLTAIGGVLYRQAKSDFDAISDLDSMMKQSLKK